VSSTFDQESFIGHVIDHTDLKILSHHLKRNNAIFSFALCNYPVPPISLLTKPIVMIKAAAASTLMACLLFSCAEVKKVHHFAPMSSAIPHLNITNDTSATAMRISMLDIKTVVAANISTTVFDISFYNPNDKLLEGEFEFPLADGQHITRYAHDMNGVMREGVVVEKAKARVAFESTVRRKIDPGLVEKTKGNNFRTRIYPIPPKGYRRILIAVEQTLKQEDKDLLYQLPLYATEAIDTFSLKIIVIKSRTAPQLDENGIPNLQFKKEKEEFIAEHRQRRFVADKTVAFVLPATHDADAMLTEEHEGRTYFYVNSRIDPEYREKKKPASIGVLWDISSSADKRDLKKELDLLKQYLAVHSNAHVSLLPFNIYTPDKEDFSPGETGKLVKRIESFNYDGGTQFGAIDLSRYQFDEVLLFSDGLSTFGSQEMITGSSPVTTITTSPSANYSYLKYIAQQTHGTFLDLGTIETATALKEMNGQSLQIVKIKFDPGEIEDFVAPARTISNNGLSFAGKLKKDVAHITVKLGFGNEELESREYDIKSSESARYEQVKRIWAEMRISELEMEYQKNKVEITKLGKEFSIVTQNTSLLVLDRVEDYVEHGIVPPWELQTDYYRLLKEQQNVEKDKDQTALNEALAAMDKLKEWWRTKYTVQKPVVETTAVPFTRIVADTLRYATTAPTFDSLGIGFDTVPATDPNDPSKVVRYVVIRRTAGISADRVTIPDDSGAANELPPPGQFTTDTNYRRLDITTYIRNESTLSPSALQGNTRGLMLSPLTYSFSTNNFDTSGRRNSDTENDKTQIKVNRWNSNAQYLKIIKATGAADRMNKYLSLKKEYSSQPSFFVDVARLFIENNDPRNGILILSNIAEMKLEDAELLRITANQLLEAGEMKLAIETFKQIIEMREEEPQSYRDLALAYNETGEYGKAVELLYQLVTGNWDERFGDVKSIALNEMNAIISAHAEAVNTAAIDKRFIYAMPVDVRIVLGWSSNDSDIDLWVTDPLGEKCFYEHTETEIGGKISKDVTQGYGPEEFSLKKARQGNYKIDVNLFGDHRETMGGPIAIKAELFTDFGKATQKRRMINLRLTSDKEVIRVGSLRFGS
jgi:hypothetical protein